MSNMTINFHSTKKITAQVCTGAGAQWLDLTVTDCKGAESDIAIFFQPRGLAERLADAINAVNDEVAKIVAQHKEMDANGPILPAGHTDAFAAECQADYDEERRHGWAVGE